MCQAPTLLACIRNTGNAAEKTRKQYQSKVDAVNAMEPSMKALSDDQLRGKTKELQNRYQEGESLDSLLVEAFAVSAFLTLSSSMVPSL